MYRLRQGLKDQIFEFRRQQALVDQADAAVLPLDGANAIIGDRGFERLRDRHGGHGYLR